MEVITSWEQNGITRGKETLVLRLLRRRFGVISPNITARLDHFSPEQLDDLGEALLDFGTVADLEQWMAKHTSLA